jgi:hypothetical protein
MIKRLSLTEAKKLLESKHLGNMSQDEYDAMIDDILELVDTVQKVDYSTDLPARIAKIKADASDEAKNKELMDEDEIWLKPERDERKALRAKKREQDRYKKRVASNNQNKLRNDIFETIADQVRAFEEEEETWMVPNRRYDDEPDMVVRGRRNIDVNKPSVPTIEVFLDYSGSWSESDLIKGRAVVEDLNEFVDDGKLKLNIFYFTDDIANTPEGARKKGSGTGAWPHIINQVIASGCTNVMILTDGDMNEWGDHSKKVMVDGCVWYLWKNGVRAENLPKELRGRMGTLQYNLV